MEEKEKKNKNMSKKKKQKHQHPNDQTEKPTSDFAFKPSSDVKGLRFGAQFVVKSFTVRRGRPLELLRLLSLPPPTESPAPENHKRSSSNNNNKSSRAPVPFPSTTAYLPTNFTILAHQAWHTLTLGLGTKKSKVVLFVFESEGMKAAVDRGWPAEIPLGEVNRRLIRGMPGSEMARFKFRKGCVTFYVYAVRRVGSVSFTRADDLRTLLESVVALRDFLDHTTMLAMPNQRTLNYAPPVAMAH